jgi:sulfite exporter TauE/SafE
MCDCAESVSQVVSTTGSIDMLQLIFNVIIFGITSSFTHCIGMCGGIAMGQSAMRIMMVNKATNLQKIACCISWEYYIGKALTYGILTAIVMGIGNIFRGNNIFQVVKMILLLVVICYLLLSSAQVVYKLFGKSIPKVVLFEKFSKVFNIQVNNIKNRVLSRVVIGMCLGLIPCGIVYSAIGMIVSAVESPMIGGFIAFLFGLTTFPGLFILSYSGNIFFYRYSKVLSLFYLLTTLWNIKFLAMML